jgi:hypothetical protein
MLPRRRETPTFQHLTVIVREQINTNPTDSYADLKEAIKGRLVQLGFTVPWPHDLTAALNAVEGAIRRKERSARSDCRDGTTPAPSSCSGSVPTSSEPPLTCAEAAALLAQIQTRLGPVPIKSIAAVHLASSRAADRHKALQIVAQAILDQVEACERLDREVDQPRDQMGRKVLPRDAAAQPPSR